MFQTTNVLLLSQKELKFICFQSENIRGKSHKVTVQWPPGHHLRPFLFQTLMRRDKKKVTQISFAKHKGFRVMLSGKQ